MTRRAPRIELGRVLGRGTTGEVRHGRLREPFGELPAGAQVAVKSLARGAPASAAEALRREGRAAAAVRAEHLVRLVHAGDDAGRPVLITRFVPGPTLREVLAEHGRLPEPRVRALGRELAGALAALHAVDWQHGDVKPENVRLDADGAAVLLDLGFAHHLDGRGSTAAPGSLPYLAPEQARGRPGGPAADVFALGLVLCELALGEHPFAADVRSSSDTDGTAERWLAVLADPAPLTPSHRVPQLSPFFDALTRALLDPDPARRPTARRLEEALAGGETGTWWRERVAFGSQARRGAERSGSHRLPLVGRDRDLAALHRAFVAAGDGGGAVWLEGAPGARKSRQVSEFVGRERQGPTPPLYLYGRCSPFREERPGEPIRALLRRWLHLPRRAAAGPRERELLLQTVPAPVAETLVRALDPAGDAEASLGEPAALAEWLRGLSRVGPLIVFLDDVSFAGTVTLEILARVAEGLPGSQALLVLGLRWGTPAREPVQLENLRARLATRVAVGTVSLQPLDEADVLTLVEELFHPSAPRLRLAHVLHERSGGLPGALLELLSTLESRGQVRQAAAPQRGLELLVSPDALPLPGSVARLIADRYRALPPDERLWLQRLAAVGARLDPAFLVRTFPHASQTEVDAVLARLVQDGWLVPAGPGYRFARPAQREAVYRSTPERRRQLLHGDVARALETLHHERPSLGLAYERAYHLRQAGRHAEFLEELGVLLADLRRGGHPSRVYQLAAWGLEAMEAVPQDSSRAWLGVELLETAADAADRLGHRERQRELLDRMADLDLDPDAAPETAGRVYLLHGRFTANTGQYGLSRGLLRNAILLFEKAGASELMSAATLELSGVQGHAGDLEEAARLARRARDLARSDIGRARALLALGTTALVSDDFEEALRRVEGAMTLLRRHGNAAQGRAILAAAYMLRSRTWRLVGRPRRAFAAIERAARLARRAGERQLEVEVAARQGRLLLDVDRVREAELLLRESLFAAREIEYPRGQALASLSLGTLLAESGDGGAHEMLASATQLAHELGLGQVEALSLALRARLARQVGALEDADRYSLRASEVFERAGGELADRIVVLATRALVLDGLGRRVEARALVRALARRVRRVNEGIGSGILRRHHRRATGALLAAARSEKGPVYPRLALEHLPGDPA